MYIQTCFVFLFLLRYEKITCIIENKNVFLFFNCSLKIVYSKKLIREQSSYVLSVVKVTGMVELIIWLLKKTL